MKKISLCALVVLLSVTLSGQSTITGSCEYGGTYPSCLGGDIRFTGSGYPAAVHVRVINSSDEVIDDANYKTVSGVLRFVENMSFADTYTISIDGSTALTVTTR
jgi:hypothetical protein